LGKTLPAKQKAYGIRSKAIGVWIKKYMWMNPKYPVYIVSKGRAHNGLTTRALNEMRVPHFMVVEQDEVDDYRNGRCHGELLILPSDYKENYEVCDQFGLSKSTGPGPARNFCIDHSKALGFSRHWVMDDNIDAFHYLNRNEKFEVRTGATLKAAEDFVDRYENVPLAGFNYYSFCKKTDKVGPYILNTRIYSCLLVGNEFGYRWRARYNEDTDLSIRVLKDGFCTVQFNAFLCGKITTQRMRGGNSADFYDKEGTLPKSKMLEKLHPDVARIVFKFNRWHHYVDYRQFRSNKLKKISDTSALQKVDNYGMVLVQQ
jgi:hypothetical protein